MRKRKGLQKRLISLALVCAMLVMSFYSPITTHAKKSTNKEETIDIITEGAINTVIGNSVQVERSIPEEETQENANDNYDVTFSAGKKRGNSFQGNIVIKNTSDKPIKNWSLTFDMDHEITSIWDAVIGSHESKTYVVNNSGYNKDIAPGQSINIGYQAVYTDNVVMPETYKLLFTQQEVRQKMNYVG